MNDRQWQILRYVLRTGAAGATPGQIGRALPDIRRPDVYRHLKKMTEISAIEKVGADRFRAAVELAAAGKKYHDDLLVERADLNLKIAKFGECMDTARIKE